MPVHSGLLRLSTRGDGDIVDLTEGVTRVVRAGRRLRGRGDGLRSGLDARRDDDGVRARRGPGPQEALERLVPAEGDYAHNRLNHDTNAHAHLRAAIVGPSEAIPVVAGRLVLGTWQQVVLLDFDDRPRERTIHVHVAS